MPRRRFYIPRDQIREGIAVLPPDQFHHLFNVLRLGPGDEVEIFDGEGTGYMGEVSGSGSEILIRGIMPASVIKPATCRLILAPALIKADRFEWVLQKATELGVQEFAPLKTRYCEISIPENKLAARMERWCRIVQEASKQCCRLSIPLIHPPVLFGEFLASKFGHDCTKLMLYEKAALSWGVRCPLSSLVLLCIGPEGGWDREEVANAEKAGYDVLGLGNRILRSETAALAAVSIIQFQAGELGTR
jgi:16S rRNA (uracil1498-N3)-methyltransferase